MNKENDIKIDRATRLLSLYNELMRRGEIHSQKEFSEKVGISTQFFTEIKKGRSGISSDKLLHLDESLDKYREWLMTGENNPFKDEVLSGMGAQEFTNVFRSNDGRYLIPEQLWEDYLSYINGSHKCERCEDKERVIEALEKQIEMLEEKVLTLERNNQL